MRILLDETPCDVPADSVASAIAAAAAVAERNGRMIVEVLVDGRLWNGEDLAGVSEAAGDADEIRLTSADPVDLVCQTFHDASVALGEADGLQQSAAQLLQADQPLPALEKLKDAFSIWGSVQQAVVMGSELTNIDLEQFAIASPAHGTATAEPVPVVEIIAQLNMRLREVRSALESRDTVTLSDTLLYELPQVVAQWRSLLEDLQNHLRSGGGA